MKPDDAGLSVFQTQYVLHIVQAFFAVCPDCGAYGTGGEEGELAWQAEALCAQTDPEAFFPEKGGSTRDAKRVCGVCPVREECLKYAMDNDERFGIWGGLSERERRRLRKQAS